MAEPDKPVKREYRVVGENHIVHGTLPGDTFTAALPLEQEARLIHAGHIARVGGISAMTRDEVNHLAAAAGVKDPEFLPNKDAVVEAIENSNRKAGE